jgi:hypothetical protein
MKGSSALFAIWLMLAGSSFGAASSPISAADTDFFERNIRPVLVEECYKCHSVGAEKVKGGLFLDTREGMLKGGDDGVIIVPGDPEKSRLVVALRHTDKDLQMPPKKKLDLAIIANFEQWVKMGAPDPRSEATPSFSRKLADFWAAAPVRATSPPPVNDRAWVKDEIDAFILAALEKQGLRPVAGADKSVLLRRASLDLTGLLPTSQEVQDFLADNSPTAFQRVVDRLLDSPHFGERWGRHWLDLARYADSNGLDLNTPFDNAWRYRDYVIHAVNKDKPFNLFVREQLAGDLLPSSGKEDQQEKWIATGFLVLGPKNFAEPNREKLVMDVVDEQIDVTCRAFLGLTVGCARCHDHKFDPIPAKDYYALAGIFKSTFTITDAGGRRPGRNGVPWSERPLAEPAVAQKYEEYFERSEKLESELKSVRDLRATLPGGIDSKELDGIVIDNLDAHLIGNWKLSNYSTNFVDKNYLHDGAEREGKGKKSVQFIPKIPQTGAYEIRLAYTPRNNRATNVPVRVTAASAVKTVFLNQQVEPKYDKAFETLGVFNLSEGTNNVVEVLTEGTKGFVVVDAVQFLAKDIQIADEIRKQKGLADRKITPDKMMARANLGKEEELMDKLGELTATAPPPLPMAMAVKEGSPQNCRVNIRGDVEKLGDEVPRGFISVLKRGTEPLGLEKAPLLRLEKSQESGRLELAEWIANPDNPLTSRVAVNRIWLHLFARGLVNTPDNFGVTGEKPSHPELLDFLAADFVRNGWSTKQLIRKIMLSSTYQMSSAHDPECAAKDPENRWFWHMTRKRLEAEILRDCMLQANGTLDLTIGGSTLNPPGAPRVTSPPAEGMGESVRRSVYLPILRGNLPDLLQVFDFPDPHALSGKRHVTTAPTQALFLMNSPFASRQAESWAKQLLQQNISDAALVERAYLTVYSRPPSAGESARAVAFLSRFASLLSKTDSDSSKSRASAVRNFCQALYESTEFRFVN